LQDLYLKKEFLYFLPIGGTAMAPLAGMLRQAGHRVEGVDSDLYPPMSTILEELEIPVRLGFDADRIPTEIDRVIIGNAVPRTNPEVVAVLERHIPHLSQAEAVAHYVLGRGLDSLVVAGTHGKTTTSAMLAWILEHTGTDPSYLVGGLPRWNPRGFRIGRGSHLVIEGDEYNSAFFDRGPKFLHYRPHCFLVGPVEFDHADLYPDFEAVLTAFRAGAAQVPRHGSVVVNTWSEGAVAAIRDATAPIVRVGPDGDCDLRLVAWSADGGRSTAEVVWRGEELELELPMAGFHNLQNAAMAVAAAICSGVGARDAFTAVRQRWPGRRLVVAFEPRSLTAARRVFEAAYIESLSAADFVMVAPPYHRNRLDPAEVLDRNALSVVLAEKGVDSSMPEDEADVVPCLLEVLKPGDVVVGCSSGAFGNMHTKLMEALERGDEA
jgi:UDP-N-acetylmuramate: L-alanyl-gamma-D-glutamyl-meso-diaminopimelate ligase